MYQIMLTEVKQPASIFWVIYIIILVAIIALIIFIIKKYQKRKNEENGYKQKQLQLLEEQNRLLREQLNRDK